MNKNIVTLFAAALFAFSAAPLTACSDGGDETEKPTPPKPDDPDDPDDPGDDVTGDAAIPPYLLAILNQPADFVPEYNYPAAEEWHKDYKGTPFKSLSVPGTIEAEDFDNGGQGVAFNDAGGNNSGLYRTISGSAAPTIEQYGSVINIGFTNDGEWLTYTFDCNEDGTYSIDTYCVSGNNAGGYHIEVNGVNVTGSLKAPYKKDDWGNFQTAVKSEGIQLKKGRNLMRWFTYGGMNLDKFVFTRTGAYTGKNPSVPGQWVDLKYPQTLASNGNPRFGAFGSPLFNKKQIGNLYTADPSAHVWNIDGREVLYVYASHDMEPSQGCDRMDRYHVFSTEDMVNWTDHGEIMNADYVYLKKGTGSDGFMWAPDCAYNAKQKLYYFYFPHPTSTKNWNNTWAIWVAISRYPDREFHLVGMIKGAASAIDPCVFVDDDGKAYIYNGGGGHCYQGKLKDDDWTQLDGAMKEIPSSQLDDFHEAAWVHKYNGKYYLSHSDNGSGGDHLCYSIGDTPLGPWTKKGIYLEKLGNCSTSHGSIVKFKGKWYAFYHNADLSGGNDTQRSVCFDELFYNSDGTIQIVKQTKAPYVQTFFNDNPLAK